MTGKTIPKVMAEEDVFAEEQQARQDELDALVNSLAQPSDLQVLQTFLAGDADNKDKIKQLVNFLADDPALKPEDELMAEADIFADDQEKKKKQINELVDSLSDISTGSLSATATTTAFLATDYSDNKPTSFLNLIGGAVLLLVAVVLAVVTKRLRSKNEAVDDHKGFSYSIMYE